MANDDSSAVLSDDGVYRYSLTRRVGPGGRRACFVMLNPSTADATEDDPTIRRCKSFAAAMGCGWLDVVNLFAFRATKPADLPLALSVRRGPENIEHQKAAVLGAHRVVCAWGANRHAKAEGTCFLNWLAAWEIEPFALGFTKSMAPRHPLFIPAVATPVSMTTPVARLTKTGTVE